MQEFRRLEPARPPEAAYYEGYHRGHLDTARMLSRRSLLYLVLGGFLGAILMFSLAGTGVMERLTAQPVVEDPALNQAKPKEYVRAIEWAKRYTVGIVAERPARTVRGPLGWGRIPGQTHVGSGIVLSEDGYILTNAHVIPADARRLNVVLGDNIYPARFVGARPEYDLAVVKVRATDLVPASLGDSDKTEQGEVVIAIGSPHGLYHTATEGIISYVGRRAGPPDLRIRHFLQTSAAINQGNSGGPLIDLTGRVIGVNTWKIAGSGADSVDGIGFAIPINIARRVSESILASDDVSRDDAIAGAPRSIQSAFLGVVIDEAGFRPDGDSPGARIGDVILGTAADAAGLRAGDVITRLGSQQIADFAALRHALAEYNVGDRVELTYQRNGTEHSIEVTLRD
jgi:S1-C subfamily serine protease